MVVVAVAAVISTGLSTSAFASDVCAKLMEPVNPRDVEIRPDGTLYLPEIKYRYVGSCSQWLL